MVVNGFFLCLAILEVLVLPVVGLIFSVAFGVLVVRVALVFVAGLADLIALVVLV